MIEVTSGCSLPDIIVTNFEADNVNLNKSYKLKRREKKRLLYCFRIYAMQVISQKKANQNLMRELRQLQPFPNMNFKRYRMFRNIMYDMEQIFMSDNVEFNLVRYMSQVLGISFKALWSDKNDWVVRRKFNYILGV